MKKINFKSYLVIGLLLLISLISVGYILTKKYQNSKTPFSFRYPANWSLCEELYSNSNNYIVHVSDKSIDCSNITFSNGAKYTITIGVNTTKKTEDTDIKVWISNFEKEVEAMRKEEKAKKILPTTGVQNWTFVKYVNNLLIGQKINTVAEVKNFSDSTEYLLLNNGYVYQIQINPPNSVESLPVKLILKTLMFK